jgi:hypothetical protein
MGMTMVVPVFVEMLFMRMLVSMSVFMLMLLLLRGQCSIFLFLLQSVHANDFYETQQQ